MNAGMQHHHLSFMFAVLRLVTNSTTTNRNAISLSPKGVSLKSRRDCLKKIKNISYVHQVKDYMQIF